MYFVVANFGDDSIALIEWLHQQKLQGVMVLSVNTGWESENWHQRVEIADKWIKSLGFQHLRLPAENDFSTLVETRGQFPSQQFHWCAGFIKGIALLNTMEEYDDCFEAMVVLPHRRSMSLRHAMLTEWQEDAERYDNRKVWYPLYAHSLEMRDRLIASTPFATALNHRSLECQPCIHHTAQDQHKIALADIQKVLEIEHKIGQTMFAQSFELHSFPNTTNYYDEFAKACSWDYGCGL